MQLPMIFKKSASELANIHQIMF